MTCIRHSMQSVLLFNSTQFECMHSNCNSTVATAASAVYWTAAHHSRAQPGAKRMSCSLTHSASWHQASLLASFAVPLPCSRENLRLSAGSSWCNKLGVFPLNINLKLNTRCLEKLESKRTMGCLEVLDAIEKYRWEPRCHEQMQQRGCEPRGDVVKMYINLWHTFRLF